MVQDLLFYTIHLIIYHCVEYKGITVVQSIFLPILRRIAQGFKVYYLHNQIGFHTISVYLVLFAHPKFDSQI